MKTPESLTDKLNAKADAELQKRINEWFAPAMEHCNHTVMDYADPKGVNFNGYATATNPIWPHALLTAAKQAMFLGLQRKNRETYIADFIAKVESLDSQLGELRDAIQEGQ